jgi:hypothetical protein
MPENILLKTDDLSAVVTLDREQAFLLYTTFAGDAQRTAHALGVSPVDVLRLADSEGWTAKLANILALMRSAKPGDVERGVNRALNFVQAHKFRLFLERALKVMYNWNDEELTAHLNPETVSKLGTTTKFTTRPMADLASAIEKCQTLTYSALNDTAPERVRRNAEDNPDKAEDLHARIAAAMATAGGSQTARAQLFDAQLAIGEQQSQEMKKRVAPIDDAHVDEAGG